MQEKDVRGQQIYFVYIYLHLLQQNLTKWNTFNLLLQL